MVFVPVIKMRNMKEFCPSCGRVEKLVEGFCKECFAKRKQLITIRKNELFLCSGCDKWLVGKQMGSFEDAALNAVRILGDVKKISFEQRHDGILVDAKIKYGGEIFEIKKLLGIKIRKILCKDCNRISGSYYEAILQLRGRWEQALDRLKGDKISKIDTKKEGVDVYYISSGDAKNDANMLAAHFGAKVKRTKKLSGMRDGKRIYRQTILVRVL